MSWIRTLPRSFAAVLCFFLLAAGAGAEPGREAGNAEALASIRDALAGHAFFEEPHRLTGDEASSRRVTFSVDRVDTVDFLRDLASAAGWSVVFDASVLDGSAGTLTLSLRDVPWDVMVEAVLERQGLRAVRIGNLWLLASRERAGEIVRQVDPSGFVLPPASADPEALTEALALASSEQGVVAWNRRLGVVVLADRIDVLPDYERVWSAVVGDAAPNLPTRYYSGDPISMSLKDADLAETLAGFAEVAGLNLVVPDDVTGGVSLQVAAAPWDNLLDVLLISFGLTFHIAENVVEVRPLSADEIRVETLHLENEDPSFFAPFERCLTPDGQLVVEPGSKTLILRDKESRVAWLRKLVERIDGLRPDA